MKSNGLLLAVFLTTATILAASQSTPSDSATLNNANSGGRLFLASFQQGNSSGQSTASQSSPSDNSVSSAGTPAPPSPDANDNAGLQSRIDDALRNEPTLGASHVVSNVTDSGIELTGTVGSTKDKQTAERIASSFNGNRKLTDNIVITGAGHSDLAPNHPAMNNGGVGNAPNPRDQQSEEVVDEISPVPTLSLKARERVGHRGCDIVDSCNLQWYNPAA